MDGAQGPPRKVYEVTPAGEAALDSWAQEMEGLRAMLEIFLQQYQAFSDTSV
jgi:DNA-binding PadR family transcriptional regulator